MDNPGDLWGPFLTAPRRSGVFTDFDGTLAPLVDDPAEARPLPELVAVLDSLARRYAAVGVLTGRPVDFLTPLLPGHLVLVGLYGLEVVDDDVRRDHPNGGVWREAVQDITARAVAVAQGAGPSKMRVEDKGLSVTLHYRGFPELADEIRVVAEQLASRSGMTCRAAKMSFELHPPIAVDKGTALLDVTSDLSAVCFVGDDLGDLPAFDALDKLAGEGVHTVRVAVAGDEASPELCERADVCVDSPTQLAPLLGELLSA